MAYGEEILRAEAITKYYGKTEMGWALKDVSFSVREGEFVALTGASGSGKSTLLRILGLTEEVSSGRLYFHGGIWANELSRKDSAIYRRRFIGFVYQFFNLIPIMNVRENILLPLRLDHEKPDMVHIQYLIAALGLEGLEEQFPEKLSGGEQQRVAIARAMAAKPRILLADEPTGNLDSVNRKNIFLLLRKANKDLGQTIIMSTHDLSYAEQTDRILTLSDGKLISDKVIRKSK